MSYLSLSNFSSGGEVNVSDECGNFLFGKKGGMPGVDLPSGAIPNPVLMDKNYDMILNGDIFAMHELKDRNVAIPKPLADSVYYIFHINDGLDNVKLIDDTLYYSLVDLRKRNGLGEFTQKKVFMLPLQTYNVQAVRHRNNKDYWVLVNDAASHLFDAYLVTENGVSTSAVRSGSGVEIGWSNFRFSPDGKRMAAPVVKRGEGYIGLYDFDNNTGRLTNEKLVRYTTDFWGPYKGFNELEFSPDSKLLYTALQMSPCGGHQVAQYQADLPDTAQIRRSCYYIGSCNENYLRIRLGPDGRMYLGGKPGGEHLSVLDYPNLPGSACGYVRARYTNIPGQYYLSANFPNTIPNTLFARPALDYGDTCTTDTVQFWASSTGCTAFHRWHFGDPASGAANTAEGKYPRHQFSGPGTYTVRCVTEHDTLYKTVRTYGAPALAYVADTTICEGQPLVLRSPAGERWSWEATADSVLYPQASGTYWQAGRNPCGSVRQAVQVAVVPRLRQPFAGSDTVGCGVNALLLDARNPGSSYSWSTGATAQAVSASEGLYWVEIQNSCFTLTDSVRVRLRQPEQGPTQVNVFTPDGDGKNDVLALFDGEAEAYRLDIYSRWGVQVFATANPAQHWSGAGAAAGIYYYLLSFLDCTGKWVQRKGTVSLLR